MASCQEVIIENPKPKDVVGEWELVNSKNLFPYVLISFDSRGEAKLISLGQGDQAILFGTLSGFQSNQKGFVLNVELNLKFFTYNDVEGSEDYMESVKMVGLINEGLKILGKVSSGRVCLSFEVEKGSKLEKELAKDDDDFFKEENFCFINSSDLEEVRQSSFALLEELKKR